MPWPHPGLLITRTTDQFLHSVTVEHFMNSDHGIVQFDLNVQRPPNQKTTITRRNFRSINGEDFQDKVVTKLANYPRNVGVESLSEFFHDGVTDVLDSVAPVSEKVMIEKRRVPWFSEDLLPLRKQLRQLERKWRRTKLEIDSQIFTAKRYEYFRRCDEIKASYHRNRIQEADTKRLYKIIAELSDTRTTNSNVLPSNIPVTEIPTKFIDFFDSKVLKLREGLGTQTPCIDRDDILPIHTFTNFNSVTTDEVTSLVKQASSKTCDLDPLPASCIKDHINAFAPFLAILFNASLSTGIVPSHFKSAIIRPLLKKPDLDKNIKNYRPVSNLSFYRKSLSGL
ncbi:uncharacterized protein [Ptychodera flava]|uniref:uncharacterized protein n=1 Tax=Ptychodera flava TaxID=63121 RepID=UPI00396A416E